MVEYLHSQGADIRSDGDCAIKSASENGHLKVVEYLHLNVGYIRSDDDYAIRFASENGHLKASHLSYRRS